MSRFVVKWGFPSAAMLLLAACSTSPQAKRDRYIETGKRLLAQHDYARAGLQFKNASKVMPKDPEAYYQMALATIGLGDLRGAVLLLREANQLDPHYVPAQLKMAELMSTTSDREVLEEAQKRLQGVLATQPNDADALNILAMTEFRLGRADDAKKDLEKALESAPGHAATYANLASVEIAANHIDRAEEILKKATVEVPNSAPAWIALGRFYVFRQRPADAEAQFQKAVAIAPGDPQALLDLARLQNSTGKIQDADKTFRRLSELPDQEYKTVHAAFLFEHGKVDAALAEFQTVARKNSGNRRIRGSYVAACLRANRIDQAEQILNDALHKNSKDSDALLERSFIFLRTGQADQAESDLREVIRLTPDSARAHYALSLVYLVKGSDLLRRQELSEALRLDPALLRVRIELADGLLSARAPKVALDLMNGVPDSEKNLLPTVLMKNWILLASGDGAGAAKGIALALSGSRTPEAVLQEGILKLNQRQFAAARADFEEALSKTPADMRALQELADSYFIEKNDSAGIARIKEQVARVPKSAPFQAYLGQILLLSNDRAGARAAFEAAKKIDPNYQPPDVGLALLDSLEGHTDSARRILQTLADAKKPNSLAVLRLGMLEESAHNYPAAIAAYKKAADLRLTDWTPLNNLANCLIATGQYDDALKYAQQAKELAPANPAVADTIGWALYQKGMYSAAVKQLEGFKNDSQSVRRYHLAMAYFKAGDPANGRTTLEGALKLDSTVPEAAEAKQIAAAFEQKRGKASND